MSEFCFYFICQFHATPLTPNFALGRGCCVIAIQNVPDKSPKDIMRYLVPVITPDQEGIWENHLLMTEQGKSRIRPWHASCDTLPHSHLPMIFSAFILIFCFCMLRHVFSTVLSGQSSRVSGWYSLGHLTPLGFRTFSENVLITVVNFKRSFFFLPVSSCENELWNSF